jgi:GxxExxY protein
MQSKNEIAAEVVDAAYNVQKALAPGLLESSYEAVMIFELQNRGLAVSAQLPVPFICESVLLCRMILHSISLRSLRLCAKYHAC